MRSSSNSEPIHKLARPHALRDILIVGSPILVMGIAGNVIGGSTLAGGAIINLGYLLMIVIGAGLLQRQGSSWQQIGLRRPSSWLKTLLLGLAAFVSAVVVFVAAQSLAIGLLNAIGITLPELDQSRFNLIQGNLVLFIVMVVLAWTTIAFGEELFYRAFLITRLNDLTRIGRHTSVLIAGMIFGAVHFGEGPVGILANGSFGILYGWIFVQSSRNLWITIIGHGMINTLRFGLLYSGAA